LESDRLTTKQMLLWTASAMSAPLAIYGGKTSWEWTLVIGILCVGISLLTIRFGSADYGKILRLVQLVTLSVAAGAFSREISACWGEESMSMPLALLALAALSVGKSSQSAGRVCCCVAWIAAILYALVLVVGLKNIQWPRLAATGYYDGLLIVAYLLPAVWLMLPAERSGSRWLLGMVGFGLLISVLCFGTLSARGVVDAQQPIYQYSKSLTLLGIAERFEAVTSVALTLGLYCVLSLLLSAAESMIKHGAVIAAVIASINVQISTKITVILAIFAWIILPTINSVKKVKKR
jgi:hypothetical protein